MNFIIYFLMSMPYAVTANKDNVTLLFVGDISFSGPVKYYVERNNYKYNDSFNEVAPYIREADISVGNLEAPFVSKDVYPYKFKGEKRLIFLDSSPKAASALSFAGFDAVTVANNHFNDFGSKGANFTVEVLKKEGIKYFGISYGKYDSSQEPLILERNGIKIGFLGYCDHVPDYPNCTAMRKLYRSGPAIYRDDIATRDVNKLKQAKVDIIVVFMHWGEEMLLRPLPYQLHITKHLMSLGVQVIIGSHPHVLQPHWMTKDNKLVAYSLGNFLFPPLRPVGGNMPNVYGRMGTKPNVPLIQAYEYFTYGNLEKLKLNQMMKVIVSRCVSF
ncbi:capsule biosynthesis protein CapA-like [Oculina patagonica]